MPTETDFKLFMDYYVYTAKGRMEDQTGAITIETCKIFWRDVRSVWHRLVGQKVPTDICHSVSGVSAPSPSPNPFVTMKF